MNNPEISVIIPAYNEALTIAGIVFKIKELYPDYEIIVVNDGSTDDTAAIAKEAGAHVHSHPYNIGNGAAVKSGIRVARGDIMVSMDGDNQHNPEDIKNLLTYFPDYDMVVGARSNGDQASWGRTFGNTVYNWLASYVAKFYIPDLTSGFRGIKADIARNFLSLLPNTYSYPTTLTLCVLRSGRSVKYLPINMLKRETGKSKISMFKDGVRFLMIIIKICTLYSPLRVFLPVSFGLFLLGLSYYLFTYVSSGRFSNMSLLLFTTSIIIFMMGLVSEQICQMRFERSEGEK
jgi:glycosyltransferase involved in cell wall biosynthesis